MFAKMCEKSENQVQRRHVWASSVAPSSFKKWRNCIQSHQRMVMNMQCLRAYRAYRAYLLKSYCSSIITLIRMKPGWWMKQKGGGMCCLPGIHSYGLKYSRVKSTNPGGASVVVSTSGEKRLQCRSVSQLVQFCICSVCVYLCMYVWKIKLFKFQLGVNWLLKSSFRAQKSFRRSAIGTSCLFSEYLQ